MDKVKNKKNVILIIALEQSIPYRTMILNGLKEQLDLPDNTACYVDDIPIPHTWRTVESHNNKFYIILKTEHINGDASITYNWIPYVLIYPRK